MAAVDQINKDPTVVERTPFLADISRLIFYFGLIVVILSLLSGLATYVVLTGLTSIVPTHNVVVTVLLINAALVLMMIGIISWQVAQLWLARRRGLAGARLHGRFVSLFSVIAIIPAILLAAFASISLNRGLDVWFSKRTKSIVNNSLSVAMAYVREHGQVIRADIVGMAADIDKAAGLVRSDPKKFSKILSVQAAIRAIPQAYLIDSTGRVLATAANALQKPFIEPPKLPLRKAGDGTVVVIAPTKINKVRAIKKLDKFKDTYLYVFRPVNKKVIQHLLRTRAGVKEYRGLEQRRVGVQIAFGMMFITIALTLLLSAIWLGLWFAGRLVAPIRRLIAAAQQVSEGNLNILVSVSPRQGELADLGATFNKMTFEIRSQHEELMETNLELDKRRRFIETVLSGVTAGVIGVDTLGMVTLVNPSAEQLLGTAMKDIIGKSLAKDVPEFGKLLKRAQKENKDLLQDQVNLLIGTSERNFAVRVSREFTPDREYGFVVTFDDITELVTAQRTSAWADVARRIAHEIKNPLTPIQLSAERIKRKYGKEIVKDKEIFDKCTDTIIRHVGDIGRMVDEFSSFARMPKPVMEQHDIRNVVREAFMLFQMSKSEIEFELDLPDEPVKAYCDRRLISQATTNLVKNATEAIESHAATAKPDENYVGKISLKVSKKDENYTIDVIDNGCGLPMEKRNRLVEPYVTTRDKGTGLGLAIVKKIAEQHHGYLSLQDAPQRGGKRRGASISLNLPLERKKQAVYPDDTGEKRRPPAAIDCA